MILEFCCVCVRCGFHFPTHKVLPLACISQLSISQIDPFLLVLGPKWFSIIMCIPVLEGIT